MMRPMLTTLVDEPFDDEDWIFEIKWDGYRALAHKNKQVHLISRNEKSFNSKFPEIVKELEKISETFVFDGEIVMLDEKGRSRFQLLQNLASHEKSFPYYYIFDILQYKGKDLTHFPLVERKELLRKILAKKKWKYLRYSDHIEKYGKKLFQKAKKAGLEGIIAKRKQSFYSPTRSRDWLKIKTKLRQEFVIGGFTEPKGSRKYFGALLIGVYEKGKLVYSGHVGGGFDESLLKTVYQKMKPLIRKTSPFEDPPRPNAPVTWIQPKLVCEVSFSEWTHEGILRQPIFQGMRIDKSPLKVVRER